MPELPLVRLQFSAEFKSQLRSLAKRYRQIRSDIQPLIDQLQAGECPGDQISGTGFTVFKVRVKNSDIRKGKSAGYRVIYQVIEPTSVLLLLIYTKSDQSDVAAADIQAIIKKIHQALAKWKALGALALLSHREITLSQLALTGVEETRSRCLYR